MKITNKILHKINEEVEDASQVDYDEFNNQINLLIEDEVEAVSGYENALKVLLPKVTDYQYNEISSKFNHIIQEEKEHIMELKKLQSDLDITSWK